jgi:capsular exopolysaccharide synthesis family protein
MGKTHEALMRAEEEYKKNAIAETTGQQRAIVPYRPHRNLLHKAPPWYEELKSRLEIQFPDDTLKTILFTGSSHRAGVSMTSHGYADYLSNAYPYKVLLIQINMDGAQTNQPEVIQQPAEFSNIFSGYSQPGNDSSQNGNGNLFVISCSREMLRPEVFLHSIQFDDVLNSMRESFDYVILDAPPVTLFSETRMMCNKFDGVVLVLEFGKTRKQVAEKIKHELEAAGANFLGVVINRRKYFIPKWIYKRL